MLYGLYLSANGAAVQSKRLDVIANNLANAQTTGFKRDLAVVQSNRTFDAERGRFGGLPGDLQRHTGGVSLNGVDTDFANGPLEETGGILDVGLTGPGFLQVSDGRQNFLTRDGRFAQTDTGRLVTRDEGHAVLDDRGRPIVLSAEAASVQIASDGTLSEVTADGRSFPTSRLGLVQPRSTDALTKIGDGLFVDPDRTPPAGPETSVRQGFLEASGTNPVSEMIQMIDATRAFETNVNMIQYQDNALGRLLQAVPR